MNIPRKQKLKGHMDVHNAE